MAPTAPAAAATPHALPWSPVDALDVFVDLLGELESATADSSEFYDRLCEATCRLARLRRAVIFLWDDARRRVRAVGSCGVPLEVFSAGAYVSTLNVPIARVALDEDRVVEADGGFEQHMPSEYVESLAPRNLVCTPMSSRGLWFGVIMAEREADRPLTDPERHTLWTLGKVAALAASARIATSHQERSRQLTERIDLARDIHESVVQRLFAVGLVLGVEGELSDADRRRCSDELQQAAHELRTAMQRPFAPAPAPTPHTLRGELDRLVSEHRDLGLRVSWEPGAQVPARFEGLAQNVLAEAVRNARKHARPSAIDVAVARRDDALVLQVVNDGAAVRHPRSGMGLRLAALEALHHGAVVEFGPDEGARWRVRLVMPLDPEAT